MSIVDPRHRTPLADDLWEREIELQALAMAIARNQVGAKLPISDVLAAEGATESFLETALSDPLFQNLVKKYATELKENGFSFQAKCRVIAEDVLKTQYQIITDRDTPAAVRVKAIENIVEWGDLKPSAVNASKNQGGPMFSINISLPSPQQAAHTVEHDATPELPKAGLSMTFGPPTDFSAKDAIEHAKSEVLARIEAFEDADAYEEETP